MNHYGKKLIATLLAAASLLLFAFSTGGMLRHFEPFYTNYYSFAWWSYIILVQSALFLRRGTSLLFHKPWKFIALLPLSITVWLIFESFNFRLSNWQYMNIPTDPLDRWTGYLIAYSTVLPGIFSTKELLESANIFKNCRLPALRNIRSLYIPMLLTGTAFIVLPLIWPQFFFPLVWLAFIFLLEPLNHRLGAPSLLRDLEEGNPGNLYLLLLSGAICGFLWELWNFKAGAKWVYTVPYVGFLKIFEMPLLGFFGFPPFAVECFAITSYFFLMVSLTRENYSPRRALFLYLAGAALVLIFVLFVLAGIDRFTVVSYQSGSG